MLLALAPINPTIGDVTGNAQLVLSAMQQAHARGADVLLLPELALCGYPPRDLLLAEGFVAACESAWGAIAAASATTGDLLTIFGSPARVDGASLASGISNALVLVGGGRTLGRYDKRLLPTYDVFDEDRYFTPGDAPLVMEGPAGVRLGLTICEDLWKGQDAGFAHRYASAPDPVGEMADELSPRRAGLPQGAGVLLSASASPFVLGKGQRHLDILCAHARAQGVWVASCNQLGGNDDLVFDGHAYVISPQGSLHASTPLFSGEMLLTHVGPGAAGVASAPLASDDMNLLCKALVLGVRDYLRKTGFSRALIGLSGGIDSALTAVLAVLALGRDNVLGVAMPGPYSSDHSVRDAHELARRLGIRCIDAPIAPAFDGLAHIANASFDAINQPRLGAKLPDLTEENLQSRARGTILMTLSNRTGSLVLTTGNKSEMAVGYATLYGDMNGGLAVLSDVPKTLVYRLSHWINAHAAALGLHAGAQADPGPIPASTLTKAPSAELRPNQTDQDSLPPYDVLDAIIDRAVEQRQSPATIARETGYASALVARVVRMIDLAEYKRRQAAVGLKVTSVAFGPGRRMPIAQRWRGVP